MDCAFKQGWYVSFLSRGQKITDGITRKVHEAQNDFSIQGVAIVLQGL